jgi:opacity protein-like surface antigen
VRFKDFTFELNYAILLKIENSKRRKNMRKIAVLALVFAVVFSSMAFASVTEKEQKLIASTQTRFERTNNLRDMRPNQLMIEMGPPFYLGLSYSYNLNEMFAIKAGAGSTMPGLSAALEVVCYILQTPIAPYAEGGIVYYGNFTDSIIGGTVGAGVDIALDNAMVFKLGIDWVKSISNSGAPFKSASFDASVNWFMINGGLGYRF